MPSTEPQSTRLQFDQAVLSTVKAVARAYELTIDYQTYETIMDRIPFSVSYEERSAIIHRLATIEHIEDVALHRSQADLLAITLLYHQEAIHTELCSHVPHDYHSILDQAEHLRIEAIGLDSLPGIAKNIRHRLLYCYQEIIAEEISDIEQFSLLLRYFLNGDVIKQSLYAKAQHYLELSPSLLKSLEQLPRLLKDQQAFGLAIMAILEQWYQQQPIKPPEENEATELQSEIHSDSDMNAMDPLASSEQEGDSDCSDQQSQTVPIGSETDKNEDEEASGACSDEDQQGSYLYPNAKPELPQKPISYSIYTSSYDEIIHPTDLCSEEELRQLRRQLDIKLTGIRDVTKRHAMKLQMKLLAKQRRRWDFAQEEGILDNGMLARVIADASYPCPYKQESQTEQINTVVSLLIDNSGSMRGRPITIAALSADMLARTLEKCGISVEILGFTTKEWKGGMSRKQWQQQGSPKNPGRLNDLRHIIYKSADIPLRKARKNLGLMLKEGILKENIDGEALFFAADRLSKRSEKRKILMVISDGAPVDDSTLSSNYSGYLEQHLRHAIHTIETKSAIELLAIGIGHEVDRYYKQAVTIRKTEQLGSTMFEELSQML